MEKQVVFLKGRQIVLRPVNKATDLELFVRWLNDPEVRRFVMIDRPLSLGEEEKWFEDLSNRQNHIVLTIATKVNSLLGQIEVPIGLVGLHEIYWTSQVATLGITIGE
jgi:RimJ/RimL family protein N-acetyltransferase